MTIEIRPSAARAVTRAEGRETFHSFAFGAHYDPANTAFAGLVALNDEQLPAGTGYDAHPHRDTEIVTWVLDGVLLHHDSALGTRELGPGAVLRTSAGSGIVHSERSGGAGSTRFLQAWVRPDVPGTTPSLAGATHAVGDTFAEVVGPGALGLGAAGARLSLGRVTGRLVLPDADRLHVFVVDGTVGLGERELGPGDAARLVDEGGRELRTELGATLAVWSFLAGVRG